MIYPGERNTNIIPSVNEELLKLDGYLDDELAKSSLCTFLRGNLGFAAQMIGGLELFPFQEMAIRAMFQKDFFLMIGGRGISKCARHDELCLTTRGMVRIGDIRPGDYVKSDKGINLVTNKWDNPEQPTIKLTTKRKYHIEGLGEHRMLVFNPETLGLEYKFLSEVKIGDVVPIKHSTLMFGEQIVTPKSANTFNFIQDNDFYYFLGLLLGDGCMPAKGGFSVCTSDEEIRNFLIRFFAERLPNGTQSHHTRPGAVPNYVFTSRNREFVEMLNDIGFMTGVRATEKKIPDFVLCLPQSFQAAFLQGLLDTDGYCAIQEKPEKNAVSGVIGLTSSSRQIIDTFHTLLLNFGIISNIVKVHSAGPMTIKGTDCNSNDAWSVMITGLTNLRNFHKYIRFRLSRKQAKLDYILTNKTYTEDLFSNYLPIGNILKSKYFGSKFRRAGHRFRHKNISVVKLRKMLDMGVFSDEDYRKIKILVDGDYYFDTVAKLESKKAVTCDITVENEHCYWGNGFINHNSFSAAGFAWLYALFNQGVKIGIISASFRQARVLFQYIEDMAKSKGGRLLEQCIVGDISHKNDYHSMEIGRSKIIALPLGCLTKDTLITTDCGIKGFSSIFDTTSEEEEKWVDTTGKVWSDGKLEDYSSLYYCGLHPITRISTDRRYSIAGTNEHKIKIVNESGDIDWKEMGEIKIGDFAVIDRTERWFPNVNSEVSNDDAYFLGCMIGDGCWTQKYCLEFINTDKDLVQNVKSATPQYKWVTYDNNRFYVHSKSLRQGWLDKWGIEKLYSYQKYLPDKLLSSSKSAVAACLSGIFDTDGTVGINTSKDKSCSVSVTLTTTGKVLATQVQYVLLHFGIVATIHSRVRAHRTKPNTNYREQYDVVITGIDNTKRFAERIGFKAKRKQEKLIGGLSRVQRGAGVKDLVPYSRQRAIEILDYAQNNKLHLHPFHRNRINTKKTQHLPYGVLRNLFNSIDQSSEYPHKTWLSNLLSNSYYYDRVENISQSEEKTYDIHVPSNNLYNASGFISHNTGGKLRGFRFNVMLIDELLLVPEKVVNEVVLPFLGVNADPIKRKKVIEEEDYLVGKGLMLESERTAFANSKFIGLSSASYQFEYLYKLYAEYVEKIYSVDPKDDRGNPVDTNGYGVMQLSYKIAPKHLYNDEFIAKSKSQMSEAQFNREYGSLFTADSGGFFSRKKMDACTIEAGKSPTVEIKGESGSNYILAIDPSWGKNESSDHFAMSVFKIDNIEKRVILVHSYAVAGAQFSDHLNYITYLLTNFNIVYTIIDNAGSWFLDDANSSVQFKDHGLKLLTFDADFDNQVYAEGLRKSKASYSPDERKIVHVQYFDLEWIRKSNERLAAAFDHHSIMFASKPLDEQYKQLMSTKLSVDNLVYDPESAQLVGDQRKADFIEHQSYLIDLVKDETSLIETTTTDSGKVTFRLPSSIKNDKSTTRARRDSYSTLVLGNWAAKCYFDMQDKAAVREVFIPYFID